MCTLASYLFFGQELREALKTVPELQTVVGEAESKAVLEAAGSGPDAEKTAFKAAFKGLMTRDPAVVADSLAKLIARLEAEKAVSESPCLALVSVHL